MSNQVYKTKSKLNCEYAHPILLAPDQSKLSTEVPTGSIQPKSVFVYYVDPLRAGQYWRRDGLTWDHRGSHKWPQKDSKVREVHHQLKQLDGPKDFHRYEYTLQGQESSYVVVHYRGSFVLPLQSENNPPHGNRKPSPEKADAELLRELLGESPTQKVVYSRHGDHEYKTPTKNQKPGRKSKTKLTRKLAEDFTDKVIDGNMNKEAFLKGNEDQGNHVDYDHACSNDSDRNLENSSERTVPSSPEKVVEEVTAAAIPHVPRDPSVKKSIEEKLESGKGPSQVYRELQKEAFIAHGAKKPGLTPRNRKQVYNVQQRLQLEQKHDDIYEVYLFAKENPGFVLKLDLIPSLLMIQVHPEMSKHVRSFRNVFEKTIYHYDTTFNVGSFYTSILSCRHPLFKKEPLIPVAVMFHEKTNSKTHELFFQLIAEHLGINFDNTIIITDREPSIRSAIRSKLGNATHLYCWNHLRQNVKNWATINYSTNAATTFKQDLQVLLQSVSQSAYEELRATYLQKWEKLRIAQYPNSPSFSSYYERCIDVAAQISLRPVLENLGIYSILSGITNNPAESTNASFKRLTKNQDMKLFQVSCAWYLYQSGSLADIFMGLNKQGDFILNMKSIPSKLYVELEVNDVVDPNAIQKIVYEGKFPKDLFTAQAYKSPSLPETTTMSGLAELFIVKERLAWYPKEAIFLVTGTKRKTYMVDLKINSCTCLRPNMCAHRLAIKKATGTIPSKPGRKRNPDIGAIYRKTSSKSTGTKKGQGSERVVLDKPKAVLIKPVTSDSPNKRDRTSEENQGSPSSEESLVEEGLGNESTKEIEVDQIDDVRPCKIQLKTRPDVDFPRVNKGNASSIALRFPVGGNITLAEIKTVSHKFATAEVRLLAKQFGSDFTEETCNWMVDSTISGFLFKIADFISNVNVTLSTAEATFLLQSNKSALRGGQSDIFSHVDWSLTEKIFIPFNQSRAHWILLVVLPKEKVFQVLDPTGNFELTPKLVKRLSDEIKKSCKIPTKDIWKVEYPAAARSVGDNALQCGPFVCFYAEAILLNWPLLQFPSVKQYRDHILATLIGNCAFRITNRKSRKCKICALPVAEKGEQCSFCDEVAHFACMTSTTIRGCSYHYCRQ